MAGAKTLITALDVEVIDSRLNLFNSKSLVSVRIKGTMSYQKGWKPYVKYIHIAELLGNGQNDTGHSADVILTPFVSCEEDEKYRGEAVDFSLSQEILLYSMNWGKNLYTVRCGEITKSVELHQQK